jgi:hypothetical protein
MSSGDKSKSKSVSLEPELWDRVETKASADYAGNRSAFIRELVVAALDGQEPTSLKDVIVDLARRLRPDRAEHLERSLLNTDQAKLMGRILEALDDDRTQPLSGAESVGTPVVVLRLLPHSAASAEVQFRVMHASKQASEMEDIFRWYAAEDPAAYNAPPADLDRLRTLVKKMEAQHAKKADASHK